MVSLNISYVYIIFKNEGVLFQNKSNFRYETKFSKTLKILFLIETSSNVNFWKYLVNDLYTFYWY